jgi:predicted NAD/FAD-binding protein
VGRLELSGQTSDSLAAVGDLLDECSLQRLETDTNYFVTLNPNRSLRAEKVEREFVYNHPVFDGPAMHAQREIWSIQGRRGTHGIAGHGRGMVSMRMESNPDWRLRNC